MAETPERIWAVFEQHENPKDKQPYVFASASRTKGVEYVPARPRRPHPLREKGRMMAPHDYKDPDWESIKSGVQVHEWKVYASERIKETWHGYSDAQKRDIAEMLDDIAAREEWD